MRYVNRKFQRRVQLMLNRIPDRQACSRVFDLPRGAGACDSGYRAGFVRDRPPSDVLVQCCRSWPVFVLFSVDQGEASAREEIDLDFRFQRRSWAQIPEIDDRQHEERIEFLASE
jgi:hypothetical protein